MTDTVNVPREDIARAVMDAQPLIKGGWDAAYRIADKIIALLAAAPKGEPVSDPYKLVPEAPKADAVRKLIVSRLNLKDAHSTLGSVDQLAADIVKLFGDCPEAPKVEQEQ